MGTQEPNAESRPPDRSSSWGRGIAVAVLLGLLGSSLLLRSLDVVVPSLILGALALLSAVAFVLRWRQSASSGETDDESDVWNAIPSWQYDGRHVESGGLTRGEQEQALREIQDRAEELDERS